MILGSRGLRTRGLRASARIRSATGCGLVAETLPGRMERGFGVPFIGRIPYSPELAFQYFSQYESIILAGVQAPVAFFAYQKRTQQTIDRESANLHARNTISGLGRRAGTIS